MQSPKRVTVELSNRCNRSCTLCPRHKMSYPLGDMDISLFTKITSQLGDNVCIVPFYRGEALIHPQFPRLMKNLERFREVQLATNGDYLTPKNQTAILNAASFLSISLHKWTFPKKSGWTSFLYDCVGAGIETQVSIVDFLVRPKHLKEWKREWLKHVSRVRIYETHSKDGFGSLTNSSNAKPKSACNKPFEDMVVYWDGNVGLCNHDWNNSTYLGNLNSRNIEEVWNGPEYNLVRGAHVTGERARVASCRDCGFEKHHVYGEMIKNG